MRLFWPSGTIKSESIIQSYGPLNAHNILIGKLKHTHKEESTQRRMSIVYFWIGAQTQFSAFR